MKLSGGKLYVNGVLLGTIVCPSPADEFDRLTRDGFKLDLVTGEYYLPPDPTCPHLCPLCGNKLGVWGGYWACFCNRAPRL